MAKGSEARESPANGGANQRGSNQLGIRQYNERLILQLIRRAGSLPKAELARITGLSPQAVSVIINRLLRASLLRKQKRLRDKTKVGQPSVPISLNPAGAYAIGVKIGRRGLDVLMIDFVGQVLQRRSHPYDHPDPTRVFALIQQDVAALSASLDSTQQERIVGIGVAAPHALGGWQQAVNAPGRMLRRWREIDIRQQLASTHTLPVWLTNDATAACLAELAFGNSANFGTYLYIFVGTFIGGGLVVNGALYSGVFDNAAALGSMPVPSTYADAHAAGSGETVQLIHCASRYLLERRLQALDIDPHQILEQYQGPHSAAVAVRDAILAWQQQTARAIAFAITAATSIIDFEGVIIDGMLPTPLLQALTDAVDESLNRLDLEGLVRPYLEAGNLGNDARALGGAILPLYLNFAPDREVLLKMAAQHD